MRSPLGAVIKRHDIGGTCTPCGAACAPMQSFGALLSRPQRPALPQGMKVAVVEGHDIGGTCVNRGCVPSKALLAASGRVREMQNEMHLKSMGIQVRARRMACGLRVHDVRACRLGADHGVPSEVHL